MVLAGRSVAAHAPAGREAAGIKLTPNAKWGGAAAARAKGKAAAAAASPKQGKAKAIHTRGYTLA